MTETLELTKWKCTKCGEEFSFGEWWCADGEPHIVAEKKYFISDTPGGRTYIGNVPYVPLPDNWRPGADEQSLGGGVAEFIDGQFSTTDPEKQYWLDKRGRFITQEQWQLARPMSEEERQRLELAQIAAESERLRTEIEELKKGTIR